MTTPVGREGSGGCQSSGRRVARSIILTSGTSQVPTRFAQLIASALRQNERPRQAFVLSSTGDYTRIIDDVGVEKDPIRIVKLVRQIEELSAAPEHGAFPWRIRDRPKERSNGIAGRVDCSQHRAPGRRDITH